MSLKCLRNNNCTLFFTCLMKIKKKMIKENVYLFHPQGQNRTGKIMWSLTQSLC